MNSCNRQANLLPMKALVFDGVLRFVPDYPPPSARPGWAVIKVSRAGICRTDVEITHGYMNFRGVLGHEFTGVVTECDDDAWLERRVVGEINAACGACEWCARGLGRHCPYRSVLGIQALDGCIAEYCTLPVANLHRVPDEMPDDHAVLVELLAAAYEILAQVRVPPDARCIVVGDGKLGILCAWALSTASRRVTLAGHHPDNLAAAEWNGIATTTDAAALEPADIVVDCTGRAAGLARCIGLCRPRGTLILKSTVAADSGMNLAPVVINELTVVGSRCGLFADALQGYSHHRFPLDRLIRGHFPLDRGIEAFAAAVRGGSLKIVLDMA